MKRQLLQSEWEQFRAAFCAGAGLRQLARSAGISPNTMLSRARREGWALQAATAKALSRQSQQHDARTQPAIVQPAEAAALSVGDELRQHGQRTQLGLARGLKSGAIHIESLPGADVLDQAHMVKAVVGSASQLHGWGGDKHGGNPLVSLTFSSSARVYDLPESAHALDLGHGPGRTDAGT